MKQTIDEIGRIWYERNFKLLDCWQDESKPLIKRLKANLLWEINLRRVLVVTNIKVKMTQQREPKFPSVGAIARHANGEWIEQEYIINRKH